MGRLNSKLNPVKTGRQSLSVKLIQSVKAAVPEPEVLRIVGEESVKNGTNPFVNA
jgi:hypothetical protein